jgi:hypothetical protein
VQSILAAGNACTFKPLPGVLRGRPTDQLIRVMTQITSGAQPGAETPEPEFAVPLDALELLPIRPL